MNTRDFSRPSFTFCILYFTFYISSCSLQKQIARSAKENVLSATALQTAHVGISIYEPAANKYWYNYQGDHYFVPASNTKIPTCYAAMKYLGDSLVGLKYGFSETNDTNRTILAIQPTGDPTLLHSDFKKHPVWDFLSSNAARFKEQIGILDTIWHDEKWGSGWSWTDYDASYMAERSVMPIYGNVIDIKLNDLPARNIIDTIGYQGVRMFKTQNPIFDTIVNRNVYLLRRPVIVEKQPMIEVSRNLSENVFWLDEGHRKFINTSIPFVTTSSEGLWKNSHSLTLSILSDSLKFRFGSITPRGNDSIYTYMCPDCGAQSIKIKKWHTIHSQPTDSLLKPMMHRSDNFFAEQTLLMVSNEKLGFMNDEKIIDTLLKTDFKDLPQKPRWVDGSGLSRYNLFTPQDFVSILTKMKNDFGMDRIKVILPTGGTGTFSNYYKTEKGSIYAKTGTLSGVVSISGFLYTKKNKLLVFSVLVNNHNASATDIRRAVEKFLQGVRNKY
ncbi:MAG: D-alanyl-D-alanine carboxypeptidase [Bacteroidota bacterium]|nr:D-alanyl-D-alanine carboxypeptidase [Bacteroidota bacterium]